MMTTANENPRIELPNDRQFFKPLQLTEYKSNILVQKRKTWSGINISSMAFNQPWKGLESQAK